MTVNDGEWTVDGRWMGGGCVRTGLRSEAIRLRRSLSVLSVAVGFAGSLSVLPGRCGFAGAMRFCRGDAVLPGRCGVAAPVRAGFAGQTDGKSPAGINFQPGFSSCGSRQVRPS